MRSFGTVKPTFWNGDTGRALRKAGPNAQLLALYLMTNPHANMLGLYYLPLVLINRETALSLAQVMKAMEEVAECGFASYDDDTETVWVHEMLRFQCGDKLEERDHKAKGVRRVYAEAPSSRLLGPFFDRYGESHRLGIRREGACRPSEAPLKPLGSPLEGGVDGALSPVHPVPVPSPVPVSKKEETRIRFDRFWDAYPKRKGKDDALRAWQKRDPDDELTERIVQAIRAQCRDPDWLKEGGKYIPHPATWLNRGQWNDEPVGIPRVTERNVQNVAALIEFAADDK